MRCIMKRRHLCFYIKPLLSFKMVLIYTTLVVQATLFVTFIFDPIEWMLNQSTIQMSYGNQTADPRYNPLNSGLSYSESKENASTGLYREHDDLWWKISVENGLFIFAYSAFFDSRQSPPIIKFNVIAPLRFQKYYHKVKCLIQKSNGEIIVTDIQIDILREHFSLAWSSHFFNCKIPKFEADEVMFATIAGSSKAAEMQKSFPLPKPIFKINKFPVNSTPLEPLAVCVKPLHYEYNKPLWFVEFVEMYLLQGASHFFFYDHSVSDNVRQLLQYYVNKGQASVLPWNLPVVSQKVIRTEAMFSAMSDCILRSVGRFQFLAIVDLDEYLLPQTSKNLISYINEVDTRRKHIGAFVFPNVFFYLYWKNDTTIETSNPYLLTQFKTMRTATPNKRGQRSKYVLKPDYVYMHGNHMVWKFLKGYTQYHVPAHEGLSHHYRICEFGGYKCTTAKSVVDRTAHKWSEPLFENVENSCRTIFDNSTCPRPPPIT